MDVTLAKLERDAVADVIIADSRPARPLTNGSFAAHFLGVLNSGHVRDVLVNGAWALRNRVVLSRDETVERSQARETADSLWARVATIAP